MLNWERGRNENTKVRAWVGGGTFLTTKSKELSIVKLSSNGVVRKRVCGGERGGGGLVRVERVGGDINRRQKKRREKKRGNIKKQRVGGRCGCVQWVDVGGGVVGVEVFVKGRNYKWGEMGKGVKDRSLEEGAKKRSGGGWGWRRGKVCVCVETCTFVPSWQAIVQARREQNFL